jgi:EAL domain-containing protein (putative c-di-GMP-specific phosphodiesterase class I)
MRARIILEMTERDLQRLLHRNEPSFQRLFRENILFSIREAAGVMVPLNDYMRLPVDSLILPSLDSRSDSDQKKFLDMAQSNAHILGRRVLFDSVSDSGFFQVAEQDLYRGSLAGDPLSAAEVMHLLKMDLPE